MYLRYMNKSNFLFALSLLITGCHSGKEETLTFYKTNVVCQLDKEIASGSRVKPLFLETEKQAGIKEAWVNREGTVIAIVWKEGIAEEEKASTIQPLFEKQQMKTEFVADKEQQKQLKENFIANVAPAQKKDKWYKGMDVDKLSMEEARVISDTATLFALKAELIDEKEASVIKNDIEEYMRTELVKVRPYKELVSDETDLNWKKYGYEIYVKYIGSTRAEKVRDYYIDYKKKQMNE